MSKREVVVLSGVRTAIADFGGTLKDQPATELAAKVVAEAVNRSGLSPEDQYYMVTVVICILAELQP
jgi:acetyl-CoA C-acetyltransferase